MSGDGETGTEFAATLLAQTFQRMRAAGSMSWRGDVRSMDPATALRTLGIDSIEWVSLLLEIETAVGQRLYDSELAELTTLGDLLVLMSRKASEGAR